MSLRRLVPGLKKEDAPAGEQGGSQSSTVVELAGQASVLAQGVYKWVRTVKPGQSEKLAAELAEARKEIERLQEQLRRSDEERETLKKALGYFAKDPQQ